MANVQTKTTNKSKTSNVRTSNKFLWSTGMLLCGLLIGWIMLIWTGNNPLIYFHSLIEGNFGSPDAFGNLIGSISWLLPIGLAMVVSFRAGQFNIGASGQMILGGLFGYIFAVNANIGRIGMIFSIFIPVIIGGLLALFTGYLKTKFKIHEVITSIMLNWIIFYILVLFTNSNYFPQYQTPQGSMIPILSVNSLQATWMSNILPNTTMNWGIFIVVPLTIVFIFAYKNTTWGTKQDIIGKNPTAAEYIGINKDKEVMKSMLISGSLAGLAGSIFYLGVQGTMIKPLLDIPGEGFQGIMLSLIAFNSPLGLFGSAFFVAAMLNASQLIEANGINPYVTDSVLALTIFGASLANYFVIYRPHDKLLNWIAEGKKDIKVNKKVTQKKKSNTKTLEEKQKKNLLNFNYKKNEFKKLRKEIEELTNKKKWTLDDLEKIKDKTIEKMIQDNPKKSRDEITLEYEAFKEEVLESTIEKNVENKGNKKVSGNENKVVSRTKELRNSPIKKSVGTKEVKKTPVKKSTGTKEIKKTTNKTTELKKTSGTKEVKKTPVKKSTGTREIKKTTNKTTELKKTSRTKEIKKTPVKKTTGTKEVKKTPIKKAVNKTREIKKTDTKKGVK